jgi:hypothetical protein
VGIGGHTGHWAGRTLLLLDGGGHDAGHCIGGVVGLLNMEPVFLTFFLLWEEEDLLCWLFLFLKGVHMTLGLAFSGVILGDGGDVGPPGTPLITSLS